ncbi:hypothetical protein D092_22135 [Rhodococcus ruber Chol-4]|nr:hypothetical protein D092_22135 [Rhodococcus ruber Chol-4]
MRGAGGGALVAAGAELLGGLGFDQRLQTDADQFGEHVRTVGALSASSWASRAESSWVIA